MPILHFLSFVKCDCKSFQRFNLPISKDLMIRHQNNALQLSCDYIVEKYMLQKTWHLKVHNSTRVVIPPHKMLWSSLMAKCSTMPVIYWMRVLRNLVKLKEELQVAFRCTQCYSGTKLIPWRFVYEKKYTLAVYLSFESQFVASVSKKFTQNQSRCFATIM